MDIDAVAEAIRNASSEQAWKHSSLFDYRRMADGVGGASINWQTGETTSWGRPCTKMTRRVSLWGRADG